MYSKKRFLWLANKTNFSRWGVMGARITFRRRAGDRHASPNKYPGYTLRRHITPTRIRNIYIRHHYRSRPGLKDQLRYHQQRNKKGMYRGVHSRTKSK